MWLVQRLDRVNRQSKSLTLHLVKADLDPLFLTFAHGFSAEANRISRSPRVAHFLRKPPLHCRRLANGIDLGCCRGILLFACNELSPVSAPLKGDSMKMSVVLAAFAFAVSIPGTVYSQTCVQGFVWREAFSGDRVCVTVAVRTRTAQDNQQAGAHRAPGGGPDGPDSCRTGFVWRDAGPRDHVCVPPETRDQAASDNRAAPSRAAAPSSPRCAAFKTRVTSCMNTKIRHAPLRRKNPKPLRARFAFG